MHFTFAAETDIGITKDTNQDSILVKHGKYKNNEILMVVICDGMGGLSKGELASATVINEFEKWFNNELPKEIAKSEANKKIVGSRDSKHNKEDEKLGVDIDLEVIGGKWELMLKELNIKIAQYSKKEGITMGTTFTGVLFIGNSYVVAHVGDTRLYHISNTVKQITSDQTFIAREIKKGTMTPEQAKKDKRRNLLLQCVGASDVVEPEVIAGKTEKGNYMLCSDGFRHEISDKEIKEYLNPKKSKDKKAMSSNIKYLIELNKQRNEKDNISAVLIKVE